jgi:hypothetical protein
MFRRPPIRERKVCAFAAIVFLAVGGLMAGAPSPAPHLSEADKLDRRVEELFKAGKIGWSQKPVATRSSVKLLSNCVPLSGG